MILRLAPGFVFLCLAAALATGASAATAGDEDGEQAAPHWILTENSAFRVETPPGREGLGAALLDLCNQARASIARQTDVAIPFQVTVRWVESTEEFHRRTGWRTESVVAAASARQGRIWIHGPAWTRAGPAEALSILTHEYAHVVVGRLAPEPLPRWSEEGLAMSLSGQWTLGDALAATRAQVFGGLPPLARIERDFPAEGDPLRRAYLASYLATQALARRMGAKPHRVDPILEALRDPARGPKLVDSLWGDAMQADLQSEVGRALGSRARRWLIVLTSGSTLMLAAALLFLYAWWKKRGRVAEARRAEAEEEPWAASLTEQDIRDIYGDPEDAWTSEEEDGDGGEDSRFT